MKGAFRNTTPTRIDAARHLLADLRYQHEMVELRHARASAALERLTAQAPDPRGARQLFYLGALMGALCPGLMAALFFVLRCLKR